MYRIKNFGKTNTRGDIMLNRKGYCYKFIDEKNNVLYVGKTVSMEQRLKHHFSKRSHLAHTDLYKRVQRIEYMKCKDEFEALQKELIYINFYKPRYNSASKIKQLIPPPPTTDKWKVYKVIKPLEAHQERENYIRDTFAPYITVASFIGILIYMMKGMF